MTIPFIHPHAGVKRANSLVGAGAPTVLASPATGATQSAFTRSAVVRFTGGTGLQSIRAAMLVDEAGFDICLGYMIWVGGGSAVGVAVDGASVGTVSMNGSFGGPFVQDYEIKVAGNVLPGLHIVSLTQGNGAAPSFNYLRTRAADTSFSPRKASSAFSRTKVALRSVNVFSGGAGQGAMVAFDDFPTNRFSDVLDIEVKATFGKAQGFSVNTAWVAGLNPAANDGAVIYGIIVYLDNNGFVNVIERSGASATLGAVDSSTGPHTYRVVIYPVTTLQVYVDGSQVGSNLTLTQDWRGGVFGLWNISSAALTVEQSQ